MSDKERASLSVEVLKVLDGAEDVRKKIDALLSLGIPSVRDLSYAIKTRVKQQSSAVAKIQDRRKKNINYSASQLRDIVGVRAVTLFDADKADVLRRILQLIRAAEQPGIGLFASDPIEEIKIYHVPAAGTETTKQMILTVLSAEGYNTTNSNPLVYIEEKGSRYSSIHLILRCIGHGSEGAVDVPVELQIRDAFEDVWGEIDHALQYKFNNYDHTNPVLKHVRNLCSDQIATLKDRLQSAATDAASIRKMLMTLSGNEYPRVELGASFGGTRQFVNGNNFPDELVRLIFDAEDYQDKALHLESEANSDIGREKFRQALLAALEAWDKVQDAITRHVLPDEAIADELQYHVRMDEALCHFYLGRNGMHADPQNESGEADQKNQHLLAALTVYRALAEPSSRFGQRAIVHYRLAQVLAKFGYMDMAMDSNVKAAECLKKDDSVSEHSWLRVRIPRFHSYLLWSAADTLRRRSREMKDGGFKKSERLTLYLEAVDAALEASKLTVEESEVESTAWSPQREHAVAANNMLSTVLDYLDDGGTLDVLKGRGIDTNSLKDAISKMVFDEALPPRLKLDILDTLREASLYFNDGPQARRISEEIISLAGQAHLLNANGDSVLSDIISKAKNTKSKC